jgi:hypothetical protein
MSDYSLALHNSIARGGGYIATLTERLKDWRRSVSVFEGYKTGTGALDGSPDELLEQFLEGMAREIIESAGGVVTWQGYVANMELSLAGLTFTRSLHKTANAVRVVYTRIGDSLLTNGGAESGAWTPYGTPPTVVQYTGWRTEGTYSCRIVTDSTLEGAVIGAGISILAGAGYEARVSIRIVSGTWKLEVYQANPLETLIATSTPAADVGDSVLHASIGVDNLYAGAVNIGLFCESVAGEVYADAALFNTSPIRAETRWYEDTDSQAEFGRLDEIPLMASLSDAAANAQALVYLNKHAWPRTLPPNTLQVRPARGPETKLEIQFQGYAFSLGNRYTEIVGTNTASAHVTDLITASEFVTAGDIQANAMPYQIEERSVVRVAQVLRDIILAGDAVGNRWQGGVLANRQYIYRLADTTPKYRYRQGRVYYVGGGEVEPYYAEPTVVLLDDAPIGPPGLTRTLDDPRYAFLEEVEFRAPDKLAFKVAEG